MYRSIARKVRELPPYKLLEQDLAGHVSRYVDEVVAVSQIAAPSLHEEQRALYVERRFKEVGLVDVTQDQVHNVIGRLPGQGDVARLAVSAHLDTVFPMETDLTVTRDGTILRGPGVGDNSSTVAALISLADLMVRSRYVPASDIVFLANSGEEGLGNLLGIREFFSTYARRPDVNLGAVLIFDGGLGMLCHQGITSRRVRVAVTTEGGHSWKDFGRSNSIALLARAIDAIYSISAPSEPRTTYNVGVVTGGTSVNTIAQRAEMLVDMRSVCPQALARLIKDVEGAVRAAVHPGGLEIEVLGERPGGGIALDHELVQLLMSVGRELDLDLRPAAASTDANWPLSLGVPAVTTGLTRGDGTHTTEEWVDTKYSPQSLRWAMAALLGCSSLVGSRE